MEHSMIGKLAVICAASALALSTAAYAAQESNIAIGQHQYYQHARSWRQDHRAKANEETHALNLLQDHGYRHISGVRVRGDQVYANARRNRMDHHVVVRNDMIMKAS
jgi:ribosomal protein S13